MVQCSSHHYLASKGPTTRLAPAPPREGFMRLSLSNCGEPSPKGMASDLGVRGLLLVMREVVPSPLYKRCEHHPHEHP